MNLDCRKWTEQISANIDGELEPSDQEVLDAHLERCQSCRDEFARLRRIRAHLHLWEDRSVSDGFEEGLWTRIRGMKQRAERVGEEQPWRPVTLGRLVFAVCVVFVIAGASFVLWHRGTVDRETPLVGGGERWPGRAAFPEVKRPERSLWALNLPAVSHGASSRAKKGRDSTGFWDWRRLRSYKARAGTISRKRKE